MFPVSSSVPSADALVEQVLTCYRLGKVVLCRFHTRGLNDTYVVETADNKRYFLRVYLAGSRRREEIKTEIRILQHLGDQNVPVSLPVIRADGSMLSPIDSPEGQRWAALFTSAPGKEVVYKKYTDDLASCYGETVAAIHNAADSFAGEQSRPPLDLKGLLHDPLSRVVSMIAHRPADRSYIEGLCDRLRREIEFSTQLELGFCHGDLHGLNACEHEGTFTFYDFDCCGWGYRAYDMAVFPWTFALHEETPERIEAMGRAFLDGYRKRRAIRPADIAAIPIFAAIREVWLMGLHISMGDRFGWGWMDDSYFDRHLRVLRNWERNYLNRPASEWILSGGG